MREEMLDYCPFLGSLIDRTTRYAFPSSEAICYSAKRHHRPSQEHQQHFCLSQQHPDCPRFIKAEAKAAAKTKKAESGGKKMLPISRGRWVAAAIILAIILLLAPYIWLRVGREWYQSYVSQVPILRDSSPSPTVRAKPTPLPKAAEVLPIPTVILLSPTPTELPPTSTPPPTVMPTSTPVLDDFTVYEVVQGDTLASVAKRFNVSISVLASANGLSEAQELVSGMKLAIPRYSTPVLAEATPTPTAARLWATVYNTWGRGLRLRAQPSTQAVVLTVLPERSQVEILDEAQVRDVRWYKVRFENQTGWCHGGYLKLSE